jgi:predicted Rossmann fold flavoprotein
MKKTDVAIIGGGASGLLCAILCAQKGLSVDLFEQNSKCAKKILVSGNGRCNISNINLSSRYYFSQNQNFVGYALEAFGFKAFEALCQKMGLLLVTLEDGRAYPLSNEAKSVASTFEHYARSLGVNFYTDHKITDPKQLFQKHSHLVIATGSRAAAHLGGNNDGEKFATLFGHTLVPAYPSLVQLHIDSKLIHKMSGTKIYATLTLLINSQKEQTISGDLLFTTYGISGFGVLDLSQMASEALLNYQVVDISINLLPMFEPQKLANHILKTAQNNPHYSFGTIISAILPLKISHGVLEYLQLDPKRSAKELHTKISKQIANAIQNFTFPIDATHGFRHAEVSGGGINTSEVDPKTMMSKKQKNLYFTGEVLDVVGARGGYNFAFAWASGYVAAQSITTHS